MIILFLNQFIRKIPRKTTKLASYMCAYFMDTSLLAGSNSTALNKVTKPIFDQLFACELNSHEISFTISKVDSKHCTVHIPLSQHRYEPKWQTARHYERSSSCPPSDRVLLIFNRNHNLPCSC